MALPCSICEAKFENPKDLGTHILQQHCQDVPPSEKSVTTEEDIKTEVKNEPVEIQTEKSIVMDVDPLVDTSIAETSTPSTSTSPKSILKEMDDNLDDTILPILPRDPTAEEQKQRFLMYNLASDPPNFMR